MTNVRITWHTTHPMIAARIFLVPWNMLTLYPLLSCSFSWAITLSRKFIVDEIYDWKKQV